MTYAVDRALKKKKTTYEVDRALNANLSVCWESMMQTGQYW